MAPFSISDAPRQSTIAVHSAIGMLTTGPSSARARLAFSAASRLSLLTCANCGSSDVFAFECLHDFHRLQALLRRGHHVGLDYADFFDCLLYRPSDA